MAFQASTELWAASGSDPLSPWQHSAPLRRVFDSTVRGYVVELQPLLAGAPKPCLAGAPIATVRSGEDPALGRHSLQSHCLFALG